MLTKFKTGCNYAAFAYAVIEKKKRDSRTCSNTQYSRKAGYNILSRTSIACRVYKLPNTSSEPNTDFIVIPVGCTSIRMVPSPLLDVEIARASPRVTSRRCFRMLTAFSRIAQSLTLEPSPKMFGLLTTVGAWPGAVICLSCSTTICSFCVLRGVNSWEHACFDLGVYVVARQQAKGVKPPFGRYFNIFCPLTDKLTD